MKKIAIIMGRGIEGCGVTKFTIEQCKYYDRNGYDYSVFASKDKSWTRKNAHKTDNIHQLKFAKDEEVDDMIKNINKADIAIINSLPAMSLKEAAIENFKRMLSEIKVPVALIQHDHAMQSIRRNGALDEAIERANIIFVHSTTNDFAKYAGEKVGSQVTLFGEEEGTPIVAFQPGMFFDEVKERYWKDSAPEDALHHKWIGRTTSWKGYKEMFAFHNNYLKQNDMLTTFEGIERSPAYLGFRELSEFDGLLAEDPNTYDLSAAYGENVQVFGPYIQEDMLERMSKVAFGYQLSRMKPHFIQRSVEYTHCEVVCTGTIPVFNKKYGDACTHRHYGKKFTDCENSGTIWFDEHNFDETLNQMLELDDPKKRDKMRNDAFEFYKLHQDASYTFKEIMENIKNVI
jgi:hypothetical protein|tara:strand:+ start:2045 stop:3250 length:1206 start_codon:yes stop_codon:yes gene_type:complete